MKSMGVFEVFWVSLVKLNQQIDFSYSFDLTGMILAILDNENYVQCYKTIIFH